MDTKKYLYDCQYVEEVVDGMTEELPKALKCKDFEGTVMVVDRADAVEVLPREFYYQKCLFLMNSINEDMKRIKETTERDTKACIDIVAQIVGGRK